MDTDIFLVVGTILAVISVPSFLSAFSGSSSLRTPSILVMVAGGLIVLAVTQHPGGYTVEELPRVFVRVFEDLLR